jgi:hypothetical protein
MCIVDTKSYSIAYPNYRTDFHVTVLVTFLWCFGEDKKLFASWKLIQCTFFLWKNSMHLHHTPYLPLRAGVPPTTGIRQKGCPSK